MPTGTARIRGALSMVSAVEIENATPAMIDGSTEPSVIRRNTANGETTGGHLYWELMPPLRNGVPATR